jgi:hypothetical protein
VHVDQSELALKFVFGKIGNEMDSQEADVSLWAPSLELRDATRHDCREVMPNEGVPEELPIDRNEYSSSRSVVDGG